MWGRRLRLVLGPPEVFLNPSFPLRDSRAIYYKIGSPFVIFNSSVSIFSRNSVSGGKSVFLLIFNI